MLILNTDRSEGQEANDMDIADDASSSTHSEKTCVTILHEMCKKFGFGVALYNLGRKSGKVPNETFWMKLTIKLLDISGIKFQHNFLKNKLFIF